MSEKVVRVGVAVFLFNEAGQFLVGQRKGSHGAGSWGLPGGHLEFGESVDTCSVREVYEETGMFLDPSSIRHSGWSEAVFEQEGKHYATLLVAGVSNSPGPRLMEPEKCAEWRWVTMDTLPEPVFQPLARYLLHNPVPSPR